MGSDGLEALAETFWGVNTIPLAVHKKVRNPLLRGLATRGAALGKITLGALMPVIMIVGAVPSPAHIVFGAIVGPLMAVPTIVWGVGDIIAPELLYHNVDDY